MSLLFWTLCSTLRSAVCHCCSPMSWPNSIVETIIAWAIICCSKMASDTWVIKATTMSTVLWRISRIVRRAKLPRNRWTAGKLGPRGDGNSEPGQKRAYEDFAVSIGQVKWTPICWKRFTGPWRKTRETESFLRGKNIRKVCLSTDSRYQ